MYCRRRALGGVMVCLVAPHVFKTLLEWPIGLILSYLLAAAVLLRTETLGPTLRVRLTAGASVAIGLTTVLSWQIFRGIIDKPIARVRNFYGMVSVFEEDSNQPHKHMLRLVHGGITHGVQYFDPAKRRRPTTYYAETSGVGRAIRYLQRRPTMRVGLIGLVPARWRPTPGPAIYTSSMRSIPRRRGWRRSISVICEIAAASIA